VAVNGASKSMWGQLPLSNLNLSNGDFGDDAGMICENRNFCFIGKLNKANKKEQFLMIVVKVWLMVPVVIVHLE
jgi:hypothetical protein